MQPGYRFDFVNRDGSVDTFEIGQARDDGDAALRARSAMLVSLTAVAVEVWKGGERLSRIRRDSGPVMPSPGLKAATSAQPVDPPSASRRAAYATQPSAMAVSA